MLGLLKNLQVKIVSIKAFLVDVFLHVQAVILFGKSKGVPDKEMHFSTMGPQIKFPSSNKRVDIPRERYIA